MAIFFLASIAAFFPGLTLPLSAGWKAIHPFDLLFVACLSLAAMKGAMRSPDWRLIAAGTGVVGASGVALWIHPSPAGLHTVVSVAYSIVVLLAVSHMRLEVIHLRVDRIILWPLGFAVGLAWAVFLIENITGTAIGPNQSAALPSSVHRLGGFTGANALILFLCVGVPFVPAHRLALGGILLSACLTLSRSVLGVGVAMLMRHRSQSSEVVPAHRLVRVGSWACVALGLYGYAFAVVPLDASQRAHFRMSFDLGGYLTPHQAALRMLGESPVVGVGPAQFIEEFRNFTTEEERGRLTERERERRAPHSAILGLAAEQGLLGLAAFVWLLYEIVRRLSRVPDPEFRTAAIAGLTGLLVGGHFVDWLTLKGLWLWIGLMVASRPSTQGNLHRTSQ